MVNCMLIAVAAALVNNVVLSQFLGLCPFIGVSKKNRYSGRNGSSGYLCYYDCICCNLWTLLCAACSF